MPKLKLRSKLRLKIPVKKRYEKNMLLSALSILLAATIISIIKGATFSTIIPFQTITIPIINGITVILCLILFFINENYRLQSVILFIQAILTTLTGYETLGTFLYSAMLILLFCNKFFVTNARKKISIISICWLLTLTSLIPLDISRFLLALLLTAFFAGFYAYIYAKLEDNLHLFVPIKPIFNKTIKLPEVGSKIILSDFGLTKRQINFLKDYMYTKLNYKEIADKYMVSISTVKKDMTDIFSIFGVQNKNELTLLLSQYKLV